MLIENTLFGERDKVKISIDRLRAFEPPEGYYLCFSGGKDSQCIIHLAEEAGVKFDAHYNVTGIDPPELVYFIKNNYPNVARDMYKESMFKMIGKKGLPIRTKRWCCSELKEHGGEDRICITGVRWAESANRKKRKPFEVVTKNFDDRKLFNDNAEERMMFENCMQKGKRVINPIIDWTDKDVWEYLNSRSIEHCCLYDQGFSRIGCIGCPIADKNRIFEFKRYPKFYDNYKRAVARFLPGYIERRLAKGKQPQFSTPDEMMEWWVYGTFKNKPIEGQIDFELED